MGNQQMTVQLDGQLDSLIERTSCKAQLVEGPATEFTIWKVLLEEPSGRLRWRLFQGSAPYIKITPSRR